MRNQIAMPAVLILVLGSALTLGGQSPTPATSGSKIGVVNIQLAIANTAEGKKALAELQSKYQPRQQELVRQQQEIQSLQEQLQKQATTLSEDEQLRRRRELEEKNKIFTRSSDDFNADLRGDRQDVIQRIGQKMVKLISDYAQQNSYSLIFDSQVPVVSADQLADGQLQIYYAGKDVNVTDEIVKRYDTAYPASASSKPVLSNPTAPGTSPATLPPRSGSSPKSTSKPK